MRRICIALVMAFLAAGAYGQQFQKIAEGTSKADVLKLLGTPTKKLVASDKTTECYVWLTKTDAWFVYLKDGKATGAATTIETLLQGLMDLETSLSSIGSGGNMTSPSTNSSPTVAANMGPREAAAKNLIEVDVIESKVITTWEDHKEAGSRFKIKNNSTETIKDLDITVYYYDKDGKVFFEQTLYPVNSGTFSSTPVLKPNYSLLYPQETDRYMTASGMDLTEWDEGNVKVEITRIALQ